MITARAFAGRNYAVYGLARSGLATARALLASGASVTAWDAREEARARAPGEIRIADLDQMELSSFDSLVVTPGLPLNRHPIARRAQNCGLEVIGDIELFARARSELEPHKVVGITGTNGKSTTTALVHHILKGAGVPTTMGGNIGLPILAQDPLPRGGIYVLELSSYQIDLTTSLDCDVAVLLNVTPDHLDRYEDFEAYAASKARLFEMQSGEHTKIISRDSKRSSEEYEARWRTDHHRVLAISSGEIEDQSAWPSLKGPHNAENAAAAVATCRALGISNEQIESGLRTYPGLPHRMERVREKGGVLFVNDSKATNPTATAPALAAFDRIRWICGGQAKTDNLDECAPSFGHVRKAYTIGEAGELFASLLSPHMAVAECETLERAVGEAALEAEPGDTVLLSPACASFDQFRDFEDRGDQFRELVEGL
ncbi:MAG TPA: UDP-N-acetylmuramoyl-L-alanine--D-glutamate ligase [Sphingomicrobium sp.]|nr:UDP-N-acetylmuramoyl-L-alanine--D-glutamate ligase [Sphingomicrobium sp.]